MLIFTGHVISSSLVSRKWADCFYGVFMLAFLGKDIDFSFPSWGFPFVVLFDFVSNFVFFTVLLDFLFLLSFFFVFGFVIIFFFWAYGVFL